MSYTKLAISDDYVAINALADLIEDEKKTLSKLHQELENEIYRQYLKKVSKNSVEKAIEKAIAAGKNECILIDDYHPDQNSRFYIFYNLDVYNELITVISKDIRIVTDYSCWYDKQDNRKYRFVVKIRWSHYCLADIMDYFCCTSSRYVRTVSKEEDL